MDPFRASNERLFPGFSPFTSLWRIIKINIGIKSSSKGLSTVNFIFSNHDQQHANNQIWVLFQILLSHYSTPSPTLLSITGLSIMFSLLSYTIHFAFVIDQYLISLWFPIVMTWTTISRYKAGRNRKTAENRLSNLYPTNSFCYDYPFSEEWD